MHYAEKSPARVSICPGDVYCGFTTSNTFKIKRRVSNTYINSLIYKVFIKHAAKVLWYCIEIVAQLKKNVFIFQNMSEISLFKNKGDENLFSTQKRNGL